MRLDGWMDNKIENIDTDRGIVDRYVDKTDGNGDKIGRQTDRHRDSLKRPSKGFVCRQ